jgi:hypothetical protein
MKRIRLLVSAFLLVTTLILGVHTYGLGAAESEECIPCNCYYPNRGEFGVIRDDDCQALSCVVF